MRRPDKTGDAGATVVEFAIALPVVLLLIWGAIYAGCYFYYSSAAAHIARVVARDASIPKGGHYPTDVEEKAVAESAAGAMLPKPTSVTVVGNPSPGEGNELTVTVTYDLPGLARIASLVPFPGHLGTTMTRTVTVRYE